ncbi:PfkB family carbohydrate kinase [Nocardia sp. CDC159]|uniref:PfkB family carbohydrate kinase n=1 Tax=Nocardia pulmonis TaxID=2951408 RepID=A0A9X2IWQ9_9NOCA|nr:MULTISPECIES: PfkB family carbohydrate kinase [Nocardia]MCM6772121.1 PfkB family carbohydrate kinase [Nocardia pulmonis]MCM6785221.1 PfkB family carbohydrate kinase [Nocardia sp. CDC159]
MTAALVVLGDVLLDIDVRGRADRRSPDAPVPVVEVHSQDYRPGGAGLAALLAARDVDDVVLVGGLGTDSAARRLRELLAGQVRLAELPLHGNTVCKQRIRATGRYVGGDPSSPVAITRLDFGDGRLSDEPLPGLVRSVLRGAGAVLVADYGRGASAHPEVRALLTELAGRIPVVWDPHPRGAPPVPGTALVTPNQSEAREFTSDGVPFEYAARELCDRWDTRAIAITLGAQGALFHRRGAPECLPIPIPEWLRPASGVDTCGAGDRFSAAATAALHAGHGLACAVRNAVDTAAEFVCAGAASSVRPGAAPEFDRYMRKADLS